MTSISEKIIPFRQKHEAKPAIDPQVTTRMGFQTRLGPAIANGTEVYVGEEIDGREEYLALDQRGRPRNETLTSRAYLKILYDTMTEKGYMGKRFELIDQSIMEGGNLKKIYVHPSIYNWSKLAFFGHEYWEGGKRLRVEWWARRMTSKEAKSLEKIETKTVSHPFYYSAENAGNSEVEQGIY